MKVILCLALTLFSLSALARPCEVYGISDSPQRLSCKFENQDLELTCRQGQYRLNQSPVQEAYHMEVEEGPVPLVFKARDKKLTVLIQDENHIEAELQSEKLSFIGTCH